MQQFSLPPNIDPTDPQQWSGFMRAITQAFNDLSRTVDDLSGTTGSPVRLSSDLDLRGRRILNAGISSGVREYCTRQELQRHALYAKQGKHITTSEIQALGGVLLPPSKSGAHAVPRSEIDARAAASLSVHTSDASIHFTEASIDHGSIGGLGDDDHTQYSLADGSRAFTGDVSITKAAGDAILNLTEGTASAQARLQLTSGVMRVEAQTLGLPIDLLTRTVPGLTRRLSLNPNTNALEATTSGTISLGAVTAQFNQGWFAGAVFAPNFAATSLLSSAGALQLTAIAAPTAPSAGSEKLYLDSGGSNHLKRKDSASVVIDLEPLTGVGTAADKLAYTTAAATWAETPLTSAARTLLDDADAATMRTTLGLVAGGAGDIWVEKAGDTMTGALKINKGSGLGVRLSPDGIDQTVLFGNTAFSVVDFTQLNTGYNHRLNLNANFVGFSSWDCYPHASSSQTSSMRMMKSTSATGGNVPVWSVYANGHHLLRECNAAPTTALTASTNALMYIINDKFVIKYDDAGTIRYFTLDLTQTAATPVWANGAGAP